MNYQLELKKQIQAILDASEVHASAEEIFHNIDLQTLGQSFPSIPYTLWQLFEHISRSQNDILAYISGKDYQALRWPDDSWPKDSAPKNKSEWETNLKQFKKDRQKLLKILNDKKIDLFDLVPNQQQGHTYLREFLTVASHTSYHLGQVVNLRRLLKDW